VKLYWVDETVCPETPVPLKTDNENVVEVLPDVNAVKLCVPTENELAPELQSAE